MQKIHVIGGCGKTQDKFGSSINSFISYEINNNKWTQKASMIEKRYHASCAVFEDKIFVFIVGGISRHNFVALNS